MSARTKLKLDLQVVESSTSTAAGAGLRSVLHDFGLDLDWVNGTGTDQGDLVWSVETQAVTTTPVDLDLTGGLTSKLDGSAVAFVELVLVAIKNKSTTTGQNLIVGAAAANPIASLFGDTTDTLIVPPSGVELRSSPIDGFAVGLNSADILRLVASTGSLDAAVLLVGRSA